MQNSQDNPCKVVGSGSGSGRPIISRARILQRSFGIYIVSGIAFLFSLEVTMSMTGAARMGRSAACLDLNRSAFVFGRAQTRWKLLSHEPWQQQQQQQGIDGANNSCGSPNLNVNSVNVNAVNVNAVNANTNANVNANYVRDYVSSLSLDTSSATVSPPNLNSRSHTSQIRHHSTNTITTTKSKLTKTKTIQTPPETSQNTSHHQQSNNHLTPHYQRIFTLDLPEGKCVGLRLKPYPSAHPSSLQPTNIRNNPDHWIRQILHPEEIQYGISLTSDLVRNTFFIGRLAMRTALLNVDKDNHQAADLDVFVLPKVSKENASILKDEHGRPQVPNGFLGTISHKQMTGVALVSNDNQNSNRVEDRCYTDDRNQDKLPSTLPTKGIGVDIEQTFSRRRSIAKKILTPNELNQLGDVQGVTKDEEVLLRFSLKESVYKAMHPLICQRVGFQEAEITPHDDGTATVVLNLKSGAQERFSEVKAHWRKLDGDFFLTSSSVVLQED